MTLLCFQHHFFKKSLRCSNFHSPISKSQQLKIGLMYDVPKSLRSPSLTKKKEWLNSPLCRGAPRGHGGCGFGPTLMPLCASKVDVCKIKLRPLTHISFLRGGNWAFLEQNSLNHTVSSTDNRTQKGFFSFINKNVWFLGLWTNLSPVQQIFVRSNLAGY